MSGCIWMFSDRIDDVDLEFAQHDFISDIESNPIVSIPDVM